MLIRENKARHLRAIGRWRVLYVGLKTMEFGDQRQRRQQRLFATTSWGRMARKLLQKENKRQSLRIIGRWRILYLGLKTGDLGLYKRRKQKHMQICAKWRYLTTRLLRRDKKIFGRYEMETLAKWNKFARLLLQRQNKLKALGHVSRWQRFAKQLLMKANNQRSPKIMKRW